MFLLSLSLFLLFLSGVAYLAAPTELFNIKNDLSLGVFNLWQNSLESFAVPLVLMVLLFTKRKLVRLVCMMWGGWMVLSTLIVFWRMREYAPAATPNGNLFMVAVLIAATGVSIFAAVTFYRPPAPPPDNLNSPGSENGQPGSADDISSLENPTIHSPS